MQDRRWAWIAVRNPDPSQSCEPRTQEHSNQVGTADASTFAFRREERLQRPGDRTLGTAFERLGRSIGSVVVLTRTLLIAVFDVRNHLNARCSA